jgi:hypothetical protein
MGLVVIAGYVSDSMTAKASAPGPYVVLPCRAHIYPVARYDVAQNSSVLVVHSDGDLGDLNIM